MLVEQVGRALINAKQTITSAESLTAGLFVATLAEVSGISQSLPGAFVTYSAATKHQLVGVDLALIERAGVVSAVVAQAMAEGARETLQTDWAVSFTGVAGPERLENQPAGTVFIGMVGPAISQVKEYHFMGDRQSIREQAVQAAFILLAAALPED
ncbi:possible competence protein [Weissella oryzae SG25]|uniref:Possible competence protein n=1 Tax=Weissella oryzae (strain DSM 25784 / JCM 18191 / LMG 30913 / SG25) TaxID=1329250 RepID=A0A069CZG8_WEIOS|nr:nicotinamide-nucleotide amidohydrolase family protein [Weissella oryzae]GAK30486.1 possible competence protein [Weissella oryzae SG25]